MDYDKYLHLYGHRKMFEQVISYPKPRQYLCRGKILKKTILGV